MLEEFLSQLGASTKITVGVSISPNIGIEMIQVDSATKTVVKYGNKPLEYNSTTREIADYDEFRVALDDLFEELDIPSKSNIVLSLPNVYFGLITLPTILTDDAINNAIISEVEQSYIFKRQDPIITWSNSSNNQPSDDTKDIAYTAIQKESIEKIMEACSQVGCTVVSIENSFNSLYRTLSYLNLCEPMTTNIAWNLMIVMQNNYSIISMQGDKPLSYYEEPLALKSFVDDEIYNAIKTSAQLTLAGLDAKYLVIISETDLVSAEVLTKKIPFDGVVKFIECNKFIQKELMPVSLNIFQNVASMISLEAIGSAIYQFFDYPLKLNFLNSEDLLLDTDDFEAPKINIGNLEVELTPAFIKKISMIVAATSFLPLLIVMLLINSLFLPQVQNKLANVENEITTTQEEIKKRNEANNNVSFDIYTSINNCVKQNKTKIAYYKALATNVPEKLWITYFEADSSAQVSIKGTSADPASIDTFFKGIKTTVNNSDLILKRLEIAPSALDTLVQDGTAEYYQFEIANMQKSEQEMMYEETKQNMAAEENLQDPLGGDSNTTKKSLFELGQPWVKLNTESLSQSSSFGNNNATPLPNATNNLQKINDFK
ncbi:MAG: hypothetical protein MJ229_03515 [bacterium]|nr:hypothetical protein [bacterium]